MRKLLALAGASILAMAVLGVGYAMWSGTLTIAGTVNTGNVGLEWSVENPGHDTDDLVALPGGLTSLYTLDSDFDTGVLINVNHNSPNNNQLQLNSQGEPFNFIWVAASDRGTITKIDTLTGVVLGEYRSAPEGLPRNPSRTTVDANGNVWSGNRDENNYISGIHHGSVVKIGLEENGQCIDRNGNGVIDTSTGLGDIRPWPNTDPAGPDGPDGLGSTDGASHGAQVQTAADECILIFQRTPDAGGVRHVSVDNNNDVWIGGFPGYNTAGFVKLDETSGLVLDSFSAAAIGCGGYGGLIDGNNVLWSASLSYYKLLRYDLNTHTGTCIAPGGQSYGLGLDNDGDIWNALWTNNTISEIHANGALEPGYPKPTGGSGSRGVVVTPIDNNVWVANSLTNTVTRLNNGGSILNTIGVGSTPTGVAVDAAGKIWVTNYGSSNVMRINPATNTVDLTVSLGAGAGPYNYSDMTGSIVPGAPSNGTWSVVYDSGVAGKNWGTVKWNDEPQGSTPGDSSLTVQARSSEDGSTWSAFETVAYGVDLTVPDGRYLQVRVSFNRASTGESPVLSDLTISTSGFTTIKNVSGINCSLSPDAQLLTVVLSNAYPSIDYYCDLDIHGTGSIPVHLATIAFDTVGMPINSTVELVGCEFKPNGGTRGPCVGPIIGQQLHASDRVYTMLHVHMTNDAQQDVIYTFTGAVTGNQFNE